MKVVVDASAVLAVLLQTPVGAKVTERLRKAHGNVHAPHLLDVEVAQVLRRLAAKDPSQADRCRQALRDLGTMPVFRYPHEVLADRVWDLRNQMSSSDAFYVALAEFLSAPLATCDARLGTLEHSAQIELFATEIS